MHIYTKIIFKIQTISTIALKAVFRECRALDLKNVIDLTFKYPKRLCVPYITWYRKK